MLCRCKYSTSLILILIISTPDVSCKHFISHGLSVEPLVLLQLYLQMPHPANVVQEEFNSEKESREAPASVCFKRCFPLQVLCIWGFFKSISKQALYICKRVNLENTFRAETLPCCLAWGIPANTLVMVGKGQGTMSQTWSPWSRLFFPAPIKIQVYLDIIF